MGRFSSPIDKERRPAPQFRNDLETSASLAPPDFALNANPVQAKTNKETHEVPEKVGKTQNGPLAIKGRGDNHQFDGSDINQGSIGDCFFLASLAAVAHTNPGLLQKAITDNNDGTYNVTLYSKKKDDIGEAKPDVGTSRFSRLTSRTMTISPNFPTSVNGEDSANSGDLFSMKPHATGGDKNKAGETELWVRLIEKAYAVLCGGYDKIGNGGFTENALEALTGKQFTEKAFRNGNRVKKRIIKATKKGEPCTISTKAQNEIDDQSPELVEFAESNDIVGGHAYAVLQADEKGLKIRNPWGSNATNPTPYLSWEQFSAFFDQYGRKN